MVGGATVEAWRGEVSSGQHQWESSLHENGMSEFSIILMTVQTDGGYTDTLCTWFKPEALRVEASLCFGALSARGGWRLDGEVFPLFLIRWSCFRFFTLGLVFLFEPRFYNTTVRG